MPPGYQCNKLDPPRPCFVKHTLTHRPTSMMCVECRCLSTTSCTAVRCWTLTSTPRWCHRVGCIRVTLPSSRCTSIGSLFAEHIASQFYQPSCMLTTLPSLAWICSLKVLLHSNLKCIRVASELRKCRCRATSMVLGQFLSWMSVAGR